MSILKHRNGPHLNIGMPWYVFTGPKEQNWLLHRRQAPTGAMPWSCVASRACFRACRAGVVTGHLWDGNRWGPGGPGDPQPILENDDSCLSSNDISACWWYLRVSAYQISFNPFPEAYFTICLIDHNSVYTIEIEIHSQCCWYMLTMSSCWQQSGRVVPFTTRFSTYNSVDGRNHAPRLTSTARRIRSYDQNRGTVAIPVFHHHQSLSTSLISIINQWYPMINQLTSRR